MKGPVGGGFEGLKSVCLCWWEEIGDQNSGDK